MLGVADDFISSPRLDNLTSCAALVSGILDAERKDGINLIALFDHEEIGSRSKQGSRFYLTSRHAASHFSGMRCEGECAGAAVSEYAVIGRRCTWTASESGRKNGHHK